MKLKLVADWRDFPKWIETWAASAGIAGTYAWHRIPPEWQQMLLNSKYAQYGVIAMFLLTMLGTLVAQPSLPGAQHHEGDGPCQ